MTLPSTVFCLLLASLFGTIFHLWKDGGLGFLFLYLVLSNAGFFGGHFLASAFEWVFLPVGPINFGTAVIFSLLFLLTGHWLSKVNVD